MKELPMRALTILPAALLLSACGTLQIGERNFIRADQAGAAPAARLDLAALLPSGSASDEQVATPDGAVLRGVRWHRPGATRVLLYFGGNMFHIDQHGRELLPLLASCGADVVVFDYRGYGRSSGVPTVATMQDDALRVYDQVSAQYPGGVIVHGQSLGSFMAGHVASRRPARGLVLEATSTSVQDWTDANVPWYVKLVTKVEVAAPLRGIDNAAAVSRYRGASLVLAGDADNVTPAYLAHRVFEAIPGVRKQWFVAPGAGHNGIFGHKDVMPVYCGFVDNA
jgi:pimeloyl-ACP methyl ester carboxylesterase